MKPLIRTSTLFAAETACRLESRDPGAEEVETDFTVVFPRSGHFVQHVENDRVVANPAVALFLNQGEVQRISHPHGAGDECFFIAMASGFVDPLLDHRVDRFRSRTAVTSANHDLALWRLVVDARLGLATPLQAEETISMIVTDLVQGSRRRRSTAHQRALAADAEEYLATHYADNAGLPDVARAVGSSSHHLSRVFHAVTGTTLSAYRTQLRVRAALAQIGEGAHDLASVAIGTGFHDHAHMTNSIRRHLGATPSEIRQQLGTPSQEERTSFTTDL